MPSIAHNVISYIKRIVEELTQSDSIGTAEKIYLLISNTLRESTKLEDAFKALIHYYAEEVVTLIDYCISRLDMTQLGNFISTANNISIILNFSLKEVTQINDSWKGLINYLTAELTTIKDGIVANLSGLTLKDSISSNSAVNIGINLTVLQNNQFDDYLSYETKSYTVFPITFPATFVE